MKQCNLPFALIMGVILASDTDIHHPIQDWTALSAVGANDFHQAFQVHR